MKKLILIAVAFSFLSCETENQEPNLALGKLQSENDQLKHKIDSLNKELEEVRLTKNYWFDVRNEGAIFLNKGIKDPEKFIENSLREKPELIPLEAVLGGTMRFGNIEILSDRWIIAEYDDGHVAGRTIYRYKLTKNNSLGFEALDSKLPE